MARPAQIRRENLALLIRARGPVSATELAAALRVNRTTIGRVLPDLGEELVTLGATRSTRYVLRRGIRNMGSRWPIFRIDEDGRASEWAELEAFHERGWRVNWAGAVPEWAGIFMAEHGLWSGFPFFLEDVRPQGFIGRIITSRISRLLELPVDPAQWSDEHTVVFLAEAGEDVPGNVVLGEGALRRALAGAADLPSGGVSVAEDERAVVYPGRAAEISQHLPGSSAGGEQPKFLTTLRAADGVFCPVLVKFTAPLEQETGRRWADLLVAEFHAHEVLAEVGLSNAGARLLDAGGRRFLEIPRFDRRAASGRMGVVSFGALAAAATGQYPRDWSAARDLVSLGLISEGSLAEIRVLQAFGELIGNSDMHAGNLAFFLSDALPLRVAPCYDMLPMLWAPSQQGEIVPRRFAPMPPVPAMLEPWRRAAMLAENFWQRLAGDERISPAFAGMAREALETLRQVQRHVG